MSGPRMSVVVPTHERPGGLAACLGALAHVEAPAGGFEVVVVDDGGSTPLQPVVDEVAGRLDVRLHRQANAGPAAARNTGARLAAGDLLAFTDDDCRPEPGWLAALAARLGRHPDALVAGRVVTDPAAGRPAAATDLITRHLAAWSRRRGAARPFAASNNIAMAAGAFAAVGGFDGTFPQPGGEDRDLCARWAASGRPVVHAPDARVVHDHRMDLAGFWGQHAAYGRGARQLARRLAARGEPDRLLKGPRFWAGLLTRPFAGRGAAEGWRLLGLVLLAQAATAVGWWREGRRDRSAPVR